MNKSTLNIELTNEQFIQVKNLAVKTGKSLEVYAKSLLMNHCKNVRQSRPGALSHYIRALKQLKQINQKHIVH